MKNMLAALRRSLLLLPVVAAACSSTGVGNPPLTPEEEALVTDSNDGEESGTTASSLVALPTLAITRLDIATPAAAATKAIQSASATFLGTSTCATATQVSATEIDYALTNCTGPLGLVAANGTLTAKFSANPGGGIVVDVADGGDLTLNKMPIVESARAIITFSGSQRIIDWTGTFTGTTLKGRSVQNTAQYHISVDSVAPHTVTIDGHSETVVDYKTGKDKGVTLDIKNYVHSGAKTKCPSSGHITVTPSPNPKSVSIVVDLLGGTQEQISYFRNGKTYSTDAALSCTP